MLSRPAKTRPLSVVSPGQTAEATPERTRGEPTPCAYCFGTGMEVVAGRGARRCRCRAQERRQQLLEAARIPRRFERCLLSNYHPDPTQGTQLQAFNYAFKLVDEYPAVGRGLLFAGPVGTGKTHLSAAILRGLAEKGVPCLFYEFGALLKEIQNSYNLTSQASELNVLAPVCYESVP
jgi:DNA replication protein DnaC